MIRIQGPSFTCSLHGPYRRYKEYLRGLIPWLIIIIAFFLIPLTLLLNAGQVSQSMH
ncbi:unnamed protein product [Protopolystoma xenopodis]|uniref:Uncharacterized protein n=1 Tax=Protopolystoma xenopodis TaxID=117903 RepID=A0A3S5AUE4_9PLAT|nr:unnamed protein product [Protopolystoma xenopodis]